MDTLKLFYHQTAYTLDPKDLNLKVRPGDQHCGEWKLNILIRSVPSKHSHAIVVFLVEDNRGLSMCQDVRVSWGKGNKVLRTNNSGRVYTYLNQYWDPHHFSKAHTCGLAVAAPEIEGAGILKNRMTTYTLNYILNSTKIGHFQNSTLMLPTKRDQVMLFDSRR